MAGKKRTFGIYVFALVGLLTATAANAQQQKPSPYDTPGYNPGQSNCGPDLKTCANYPTGSVTSNSPPGATKNVTDPQGPGSDLRRSNCGAGDATCAAPTGSVGKTNPVGQTK
jgi:hypothetical protein